jgi:hypothetical protein
MTFLNRTRDEIYDFSEQDAKQFRRIFAVSVIVFLVVAIVARLFPRSLRPWASSADERKSVVAEAKDAANRFIPFAFMGE